MKKITNLLIVCSLALAGAVIAQEPTPAESQAPGKKADKKAPAEVKPKTHAPKADTPAKPETPAAAPKTEAPAVKEKAAKTEAPTSHAQPPQNPADHAPAMTPPASTKTDKKANKKSNTPAAPNTSTEAPAASTDAPAASTSPAATKEHKNSKKAPAPNASTSPSASAAAPKTSASPAATSAATTPATTPAVKTTASATPAAATASTTPATTASTTPATTASTTPATAASASAAPSVAAQTSPGASVAAAKKPDPAKVQQIRQQYTTFRAQPRVDIAPAVTFSANYRLPGVERWQGPQYEVYRSYRPERHDQGYYRSRYQRVELIAGGYYYFNNGYWYPAWGYSPREEYYAYDAPIYAGKQALPPDKVIAQVQAVLKEMGYYRGEVDGLLGPLTREALTGYQTDNGMTVTAVIDEPTLESLNMG